MLTPHPDYLLGPTACAAAPAVVRSIKQEVKEQRALSVGDVRLATAMGLLATDTVRAIGFNDGVFYALEESAARAPGGLVAPSDLVRLPPKGTPRTMHALALLVDFDDLPGTRPAQEFEQMLFNSQQPASMAAYYAELSNGLLQLTGEVVGYLRMPHPSTHYTAGQSGTGEVFPHNAPGLLADALAAFSQRDSLARFDKDGDGYADGVFLIHAGGGAEAEPDPLVRPHKIWSHKWVLPTPFVQDGVKVFAYSTEPEDGRMGVFAHEFGHVLGLPDLYDNSYRSRGVGDWCLMGGGSWGGHGDQPVRLSCWCLARLGWIKPQSVRDTTTLTIPPLAQEPDACYQVWPHRKKGQEYFLLECRRRSGRDEMLPGAGLAIWHVDETQPGNVNPLGYLVSLIQADGRRDLEYNRNSGDPADLFPGSRHVTACGDDTVPTTRLNNGPASGICFADISYSATSGLATVTVRF